MAHRVERAIVKIAIVAVYQAAARFNCARSGVQKKRRLIDAILLGAQRKRGVRLFRSALQETPALIGIPRSESVYTGTAISHERALVQQVEV
jgi:hypothetical protein